MAKDMQPYRDELQRAYDGDNTYQYSYPHRVRKLEAARQQAKALAGVGGADFHKALMDALFWERVLDDWYRTLESTLSVLRTQDAAWLAKWARKHAVVLR